jgi:hypothetical protein
LFRVCAGVEDFDNGTVSMMTTVLAYCPEHRDEVLAQYHRELETDGKVAFVPVELADLTPADLDEFLTFRNRSIATGAFGWQMGTKPMFQPVDPAR